MITGPSYSLAMGGGGDERWKCWIRIRDPSICSQSTSLHSWETVDSSFNLQQWSAV